MSIFPTAFLIASKNFILGPVCKETFLRLVSPPKRLQQADLL